MILISHVFDTFSETQSDRVADACHWRHQINWSNSTKPTMRIADLVWLGMTAEEVSSICREVFALGVVEPLLGKRRDCQVDRDIDPEQKDPKRDVPWYLILSDDVRVSCKLRPSGPLLCLNCWKKDHEHFWMMLMKLKHVASSRQTKSKD